MYPARSRWPASHVAGAPAHRSETHRDAVNEHNGFRAVAEQIAALPFAGDVLAGCRFEPHREDRLSAVLSGAVLSLALVGGVPILGEQADYRFTPVVRVSQCYLPRYSRRHIKIEENLVNRPTRRPTSISEVRHRSAQFSLKDSTSGWFDIHTACTAQW